MVLNGLYILDKYVTYTLPRTITVCYRGAHGHFQGGGRLCLRYCNTVDLGPQELHLRITVRDPDSSNFCIQSPWRRAGRFLVDSR